MSERQPQLRWSLVVITLFLAFALSIMVLPSSLAPFRPAMVPMVAFYWTLASPGQFGLFAGASLGLMLDVLTGSLLGSHVLALTVGCYLIASCARVVRFWPSWQQSLLLLPTLALYAIVLFWIDGVTDRNADAMLRFMPVMTSALAWPLLCGLIGWWQPLSTDN